MSWTPGDFWVIGIRADGGVRRLAKDGTVQGWSGNRVRDGGVEGMELGNGEVGCAVEEAL